MSIIIPDFSTAKVMVVGDVMLDQYWYGNTQRISPEAPVPVVHVRDNEIRAGGASNVALNISSLGGKPLLLGLTGDDDNADKLEQLLSQQNVDCSFQRSPTHDTCLKLRVIAQHQQMIRLDFEDDFADLDKFDLIEQFKQQLTECDVIILSDYNKGTLSAVAQLIESARKVGKPIIIDPKGTDFEKYRGATLLTPNRHEFEAVVGACENTEVLVEKAEKLRESLDLEALLVTRGEEGMTLCEKGQPAFHLPTYAREVFDVTGAGDTVIGTLATAMAAKCSFADAVALANLAAGNVVRKLGTATTSIVELQQAQHQRNEVGFGQLDEDQLEQVIIEAHQRGEKVIMTNGCFDLMHTGHIAYLEQARALGDRLVVAVNSDDSVRQLKGESRPIHSIDQRMIMLAALQCVDWVVAFSEKTPERLYCRILPDVIVKGGDYTEDQVAGGECVKKQGGDVQILSFVEGQSTSHIIEKIRISE
ncbi:MAG: bifunctional D-glycero-beta-D-manno-heptose-7-phosphate kinase/D-glycero-beta-D-manno-heptose 1-phosphate adenylyltransferase HldE [Thiotrichaceae bacterium]|nr:bifunctional D-glycero-beta-D-manno-heptose-7-phosphate kinase/D-glycero-beta-D-manno-heptose 1-phosphate adenylyltransferase HldE [Thiotrichaceae bacterium]